MIDDSSPWKEELWMMADRLEKCKRRRRWTDQSAFLVERDVMFGAYAIRKLIEAHKISDQATAEPLNAERYGLADRVPDLMNFHRPWDNYDLSAGDIAQLSLREFSNQVIHSFIFTICTNQDGHGFNGLLFSSDRARREFVYFVNADSILTTFRRVAEDDIVEKHMVRESSGEMRVTSASREHEQSES
jgi:hypothetical protein